VARRDGSSITGNPSNGGETGVVGPPGLIVSRCLLAIYFITWSRRHPKPEEIAAAVRAGSASANRERALHGRETLEVLGWGEKPSFDRKTGRLEFQLKTQESGGRRVENRFVYFPGKRGVLEIELINEAGTATSGFEQLLEGVGWQAGEQYQEPADWILVLITGVAAAVAAALGLRIWRQRGQ